MTATVPQPGLFKDLPSPVKLVLKPILYGTIALHGLLLFVPLPSSNKLEIPEDKDFAIKITQLPPAKPAPKLSEAANKPGAGDSGSAVSTSGGGTNRRANFAASGDDSGVSSSVTVDSRPARSNRFSTTEPETFSGSFSAFPHYNPSELGCYDRPDCYTVTATNLAKVDAYFTKTLKEKDFGVRDVRNESTIRIYRLRGGLEERYLTIMADGSNTVYVLSARPIESLQALKNAQAEAQAAATSPATPTAAPTPIAVSTPAVELAPVPDSLRNLLTEDAIIPLFPIPSNDELISSAGPQYFEQPGLFFILPTATAATPAAGSANDSSLEAQPVRGIENFPQMVLGKTPDQFYTQVLAERLTAIADSVTPIEPFGGGSLYEMVFQVEGKPVTLYLSLLPLPKAKAPDQKEGTIVVLWTRDPRPLAKTQTTSWFMDQSLVDRVTEIAQDQGLR